tara:strand:- start:404 stop:1573 length:1170 start_codon:yes stop_codon:yes gene_type:complete
MANTLKFGAGNWATKEGSTLAYNDENGNFKPLPFDFTRASSATVVNKAGLIETVGNGIPRIDFLDNTKGALLLEPQRTNLITYSEDISQSSWVKQSSGVASSPVVTASYGTSPNGGLNADRVIFNIGGGSTSSDFSQINNPVTVSAGNVSNSVYIKSNTTSNYTMSLVNASGSASSILVTTEWQRFEVTSTPPSASVSFRLRLRGGESTSDFADVSVWGAQIEVGSYATSYIPTQGSAVTRVADTCNNGGNDQVINSTEGVLYVEGSFNELFRLGISENASSSNRVLIGQSSSSLSYIVSSASSPVVNNSVSGYQFNQNLKLAAKYKQNDFALWVNGIEVITVSSGNTPTALNSLDLKGQGLNAYGNIKDLRVYNTALTDAELQSLTTI